jgi:hypothetical protein
VLVGAAQPLELLLPVPLHVLHQKRQELGYRGVVEARRAVAARLRVGSGFDGRRRAAERVVVVEPIVIRAGRHDDERRRGAEDHHHGGGQNGPSRRPSHRRR